MRFPKAIRTLALIAAVTGILSVAPRRAAALDDTVRDIIIGSGAALALGAVVGLVVYLVQEPYVPPKAEAEPPKKTASRTGASVGASFAAIGLRPLPLPAASPEPRAPSIRPLALRF